MSNQHRQDKDSPTKIKSRAQTPSKDSALSIDEALALEAT